MKKIINIQYCVGLLILVGCLTGLTSCENNLENKTFGTFAGDTFFKTASDAQAAVSAMYTGLVGGNSYADGWGAAQGSFRVQANQTTDEGICYWGDGGSWANLNALNFTPDFTAVTGHYTTLMPYISQITINIEKIQAIGMDATLKAQYIGELKGLRGYYAQLLYLFYGPVPIRINAADVNNLSAAVMPRPTREEMVKMIVKDLTEAAAVLPDRFTGPDYGRFSKSACYTVLLKLYMQEKQWAAAVEVGRKITGMGLSLVPNYEDNFNSKAKGGNSELILAIVCSATNGIYNNRWLAHALPADYKDPSGIPLTTWGGYRMPWKTYDKIDHSDKRLSVLLQKYPIGVNAQGTIKLRDARAEGDIGAVMVKFGPDPSRTNSERSGIDEPVFRYADVELLLAEALNELNSGPTPEAYQLLNDVRTVHGGLPAYPSGSLNQAQFRSKIQTERLSELWAEGVRRDDLIRWGLYVQRAKDDGSPFATDNMILYPLPRSVVNQSNGVIKQNPDTINNSKP